MTKLKTFVLIERISTLLRSEQRKKYATLGLQPVHVQAMEYLGQCNRFSNTPAALTEHLGLTKGTLSQTLQVLVRKGYIEKQADTKDRRIVRLKLLETGKQLLNNIRSVNSSEQASQNVSKSNFTSLNKALTTMLNELQKVSNTNSFGLCNSCTFFIEQDNHFFCNSRQESMTQFDAGKICCYYSSNETPLTS
jgi:DNA-binding MarR family transcriptional regulator